MMAAKPASRSGVVARDVGGRSYGLRMAYDTELADRIRELLAPLRGVDEQRMFGGLVFLFNGHMTVAASGQGGLLVRVTPEDTEKLLARAHVSAMMMVGREARGWLRVDADGVKTKRQLNSWVTRSVDYVRTLAPK
jgi:TfoX/Sxy family transcriptional regulator of competence genes